MLENLEIRFETKDGKFIYEFGTHFKKTNNTFVKIGLTENEILELKGQIYKSLNLLFSKVIDEKAT